MLRRAPKSPEILGQRVACSFDETFKKIQIDDAEARAISGLIEFSNIAIT